MMPTLTIFTPLYNRRNFLPQLYQSLINQTCKDFEWIVVDDGSEDNPAEFFYDLKDCGFPLSFFRQQNGGKHRAINRGVNLAKGNWFMILDSDDWLSEDAVEIIKNRVREIQNDSSFAAVCGLRINPNGKVIGSQCNYEVFDTRFFDYRFKYNIKGDRAEIVRTSVMREFPFPEIPNENFIGEAILWNAISLKYKTRFTNDTFYICDYQPGGLTDTFEKQMRNNPIGAMLNQKAIIKYPNCPILFRWLATGLYYRYRGYAKKEYSNKVISELIGKTTIRMKVERVFYPIIKAGLSLRNLLINFRR